MKKQILGFLAALCLFFPALAQVKQPDKKIKNAVEFTPISKPGVAVPYITVPVEGLDGGVSQLNIAGTGNRLLILDFWATWCSPCRALFAHADSLQRRFGDKVLFLPVTYESKAVAKPVLTQIAKIHPFELPQVYGDKILVDLFPHRELPHEVWIRNGRVVAITGSEEANVVNIRKMLANTGGELVLKKDSVLAFDRHLPMLNSGNGGDGSGVIYHELLSRYIEGIHGGVEVTTMDSVRGQRFSVYNSPLINLWETAYYDSLGYIHNNRLRLLTRDSALLTAPQNPAAARVWARSNSWTYELVVPPNVKGYPRMREGLRLLFPQYDVRLETRQTRSWVLVRTSKEDKLKSANGPYRVNIDPFGCHIHAGHLVELFWRLDAVFQQNSPIPVVNGTGYTGLIDLDFDAPLNDIAAMNKALAKYDLAFVEQEWPVKMLVISDAH